MMPARQNTPLRWLAATLLAAVAWFPIFVSLALLETSTPIPFAKGLVVLSIAGVAFWFFSYLVGRFTRSFGTLATAGAWGAGLLIIWVVPDLIVRVLR